MNFICPEICNIDPKLAIKNYIYQMTDTNNGKTYSYENGVIYSLIQTIDSYTDKKYVYSPKSILNIFSQKEILSYAPSTLTNIITHFNDIDISFNPSTMYTDQDFIWVINSLSNIKSSLFLTIFTDNGVICTLPQRGSANKYAGSVLNNNIIRESNLKITLDGYDGAEYSSIYNSKYDTVKLYTYAQEHLNGMARKRNALSNIISFYMGDIIINPLDWVDYDGRIFIIMGKRVDKDGNNYYDAVLEDTGDYVTSADNLTVYDSLNSRRSIPTILGSEKTLVNLSGQTTTQTLTYDVEPADGGSTTALTNNVRGYIVDIYMRIYGSGAPTTVTWYLGTSTASAKLWGRTNNSGQDYNRHLYLILPPQRLNVYITYSGGGITYDTYIKYKEVDYNYLYSSI